MAKKMFYVQYAVLVLLFISNAVSAQKLKQGDDAPDFKVQDVQGQTIELKNFEGQKVWLAFFRYAGCPVCNARVHELMENYYSIKAKGYTIIAIFESENKILLQYLDDSFVPFYLVGNPDLGLYKRYGVEKSFLKILASGLKSQTMKVAREGEALYKGKKYKRDGGLTRLPADIIIDEHSKILTAYYGKTISSHLPLSEILNTQLK